LKSLEGRVHLHYARISESRLERTRGIVEAVRTWGPDAIVGVGTDASVARVWMYASYPYVAVTLGGVPRSGRADIFGRPPAMAQPWPPDLQRPGAVRDYIPFFELPVAQRSWSKADLGWTEEERVLVTVSNRLSSELTPEFLTLVLTALQEDARLRWVLVGVLDLHQFPQLAAANEKIRLHGYENDLAGLYGACDLYVNPFRSGGGVSVGMAMKAGLPVLTRKDSVDARSWVGDAAEALDGDGYARELRRLVGSAEARREMGARMKRRVEAVSEEKSTARLVELLKEARSLYRARISASGSPDQSR
jgi:glycosyltransferase involved in cell wall biosynthesis